MREDQWLAMDLAWYRSVAERLQMENADLREDLATAAEQWGAQREALVGEVARLNKPVHPDDARPKPGYSEGYKAWREKRMQHAD